MKYEIEMLWAALNDLRNKDEIKSSLFALCKEFASDEALEKYVIKLATDKLYRLQETARSSLDADDDPMGNCINVDKTPQNRI
jgi:hypothetical protein